MHPLVNVIADELITCPAEIDALYEKLPAPKRAVVDMRDGGS
ncbi:MAG: hypothetical protein JWM77_865 [Rhodospirillales bacterium]|jgi:hypothetical protein|nr:hypothetical protein [Rhodospirillales bacterium]